MLVKSLLTLSMLLIANIFMTFAWYGHLKYKSVNLLVVILISWSIAFIEYCFQVPANRIGSSIFSTAQLKAMQEIITLTVFSAFSIFYLKEAVTLNHLIGFVLIIIAAYFIFK